MTSRAATVTGVQDFRACAGRFATGVCVVTARGGDGPAGMTLNSFVSVSLEPLLVLVSFAHGTRTLQAATTSRRFAVSVLAAGQEPVALVFATRGAPFPGDVVEATESGALVVTGAIAHMDCSVHDLVLAGDHELVIGTVERFGIERGEPLVFHAGRFGSLHQLAHRWPEEGLFEQLGWS